MIELKEILLIILPLIRDFIQSMKDKQIRQLKLQIKNASTPGEKLEAARKIAEYRYNK